MKIAAIFAAATVLIAASTTAQVNDAPLTLSGTVVPRGTKTYTAGLRKSAAGSTGCGGSLIIPTHVLTVVHCADAITHVAVDSHFRTGAADGERIPVVKRTIHPDYNEILSSSNDFMVSELTTPSKHPPVTLAAGDDLDYVVDAKSTVMGWGATRQNGPTSRELLSVDVAIVDDELCITKMNTYLTYNLEYVVRRRHR